MAVRELGTGRSRLETLRHLGIGGAHARAQVAPNLRLADGINAVRTILPRCWFDAERCERGLAALKQYQRHWNEARRTYEAPPTTTGPATRRMRSGMGRCCSDWCPEPRECQ